MQGIGLNELALLLQFTYLVSLRYHKISFDL